MARLNRLGIGGLLAVEAVGRLGSLRAAADEIGVTPGAISQQVQKTERYLGRTLFERRPTGMTPTPRGNEVIQHLTRGMSELSAAIALAEHREPDTLTVSVAPVFAGKWLVWRLNSFQEAHPDIRIRIDATSSFIDPSISNVDVCIRVGSGNWSGVKATKLADQRVFPVCCPALATQINSPSDITKVPVIRDRGAMFTWDTWLKPNGIDAADLGEGPVFSNASLCLDAAVSGQGIFLAWDTLACDAIKIGHLVAPFSDRHLTGFSYWYVTGQYVHESQGVRKFEKWLRNELEISLSAN